MKYRSLFLIFTLLLIVPQSKAQDSKSKILYSELVIYRSKVDKTDSYLRKLEMIETAWIEKWDKSLLEERISAIDASPNEGFSEALGLASMLPGWYGRAAKGIKIYDYGARSIKESAHKVPSIDNFELQVRETVNRLMDFVDKDSKLAKTINKYLEKEFGDIKAKPSDIANFYPPFADHLTIEELKQMLKKQSAESDEVKKLLNKLQFQYNKIQQAADAQINFDKKIRDINEWYTYGTLVSRIVGLKNPQLGNQLSLAVSAYQRGAIIAAQRAANHISGSLASANYTLLALDMISAISPTPEQQILDGIAGLHKLIIQQTEQILNAINVLDIKVDEINRKIDLMYDEIILNRSLLTRLHDKVNQLRNENFYDRVLLLNAMRAGFNRDLKNAIKESIGKKGVAKIGTYEITKELFFETLLKLHSYATDHLKDPLANPSQSTQQTPEKLLDELASSPQISNLSFLSSFLLKNGIGTTYNTEMDASMWIISATAIYELVTDWPEYQTDIDPNSIKQVYEMGLGIEKFAISSRFSNNPSLYRNLLNKIQQEYLDYSKKLQLEVLTGMYKDQNISNLISNIQFNPISFDTLSSEGLINAFYTGSIVKSIPMNSKFASGSWGEKKLNLPQTVSEKLPGFIKAAYQVGAIDLSARYYSDHGGVATYNDTLVVFAHLKNSDTVLRIFERRLYQPKSSSRYQVTSQGLSHGPDNPQQTVDYWISGALMNQKEIDLSVNLKLVDSLTKARRIEYIDKLWISSVKNLESTSDFSDISNTLDGYFDLLIHLVSIGHSESFLSNDTLNNLLFNMQFRCHKAISEIGISNKNFKEYKNELSLWNEGILKYLTLDKKDQKLPYTEVTAILDNLKDLYDNLQKDISTRSSFAKQRFIIKE